MATNKIDIQITATGANQATTALNKVGTATKGIGTAFDTTEAQAAKLQSRMERLGNIRNIGASMAVGGAAAVAFSNRLVELGQNVEESENLVKESFGAQLGAIQQWSDGLQQSLGLTATEVRKNAGTFNVMFNSMGLAEGESLKMSQSLTTLAYDLASFYNLSNDQAFDKLRAGITGEAEPLKRLGILLNEDTIKTFAYKNGIAQLGAELTEQQKVQARYGAILEQTAKAQGDLARTADSAANSQRRAEAAATRAGAAIGMGAKDAKKWMDGLGGSILSVVSGSEGLAKGAGFIFTLGSYAATAAGSILGVVSQFAMLRTARALATVEAGRHAAASNIEAASVGRVGGAAQITSSRLTMMGRMGAIANTSLASSSAGAVAGVTALGVAAGVAAGYILFRGGQAIGILDREVSFVDRLTDGYNRLSDAILATNNIQAAQLAKNVADADAATTVKNARTLRDVQSGKISPEQADAIMLQRSFEAAQSSANAARIRADENRRRAVSTGSGSGILGGILGSIAGAVIPGGGVIGSFLGGRAGNAATGGFTSHSQKQAAIAEADAEFVRQQQRASDIEKQIRIQKSSVTPTNSGYMLNATLQIPVNWQDTGIDKRVQGVIEGDRQKLMQSWGGAG